MWTITPRRKSNRKKYNLGNLDQHDIEDSDKGLEDSSSNSDDKSYSMGGAMKEENSSYITFTSKPNEWNKKTTENPKRKINYEIIENVTILEV